MLEHSPVESLPMYLNKIMSELGERFGFDACTAVDALGADSDSITSQNPLVVGLSTVDPNKSIDFEQG